MSSSDDLSLITTATSPSQPSALPTVSQQISIKLTPSNFLLWQTQLRPIIQSYNLIHHIDGSQPPPDRFINNNPNPAYLRWFQHDQMVLGWITCSLSEGVLPQVVGATTARTAWARLSAAFATGSRAQVRQLRSSLLKIERKNDTISVYMQHAKCLFDQLSALDSPISQEILVDSILGGLGETYRPFTRALEARLTPVTFDDLYGLLLSEELQLGVENNSNSTTTPTAHFTARQNSQWRDEGGAVVVVAEVVKPFISRVLILAIPILPQHKVPLTITQLFA